MTELLLLLTKKELRKEVSLRRKAWQNATSYEAKMETGIAYNKANNLYRNN
tara:strand:- start:13536 stop:13688 length:153 start_codon:yes stop_codon:yes gene_type:complete